MLNIYFPGSEEFNHSVLYTNYKIFTFQLLNVTITMGLLLNRICIRVLLSPVHNGFPIHSGCMFFMQHDFLFYRGEEK